LSVGSTKIHLLRPVGASLAAATLEVALILTPSLHLVAFRIYLFCIVPPGMYCIKKKNHAGTHMLFFVLNHKNKRDNRQPEKTQSVTLLISIPTLILSLQCLSQIRPNELGEHCAFVVGLVFQRPAASFLTRHLVSPHPIALSHWQEDRDRCPHRMDSFLRIILHRLRFA
jgi:hypothetical protein